jgi:hypothetical protein
MRQLNRAIRITKILVSNPSRFASRLKHEFLAPTTLLSGMCRNIYTIFFPNRSALLKGNADRLLFVYDTLVNPVTFDFMYYMYYADCMRRRMGKRYIDILFVNRADLAQSREENYVAAIGDDNIYWRISNLLVPMTRLYEAVGRVCIVDKDMAFEIAEGYSTIHPQGYSYSTPKTAAIRLDDPGYEYGQALTVSKTAQQIIEAYIPSSDKRRIVTITLRTYDYIPVRNSSVASWVAFARTLDPTRFRVIFVPDASKQGVQTFHEIKEFETFDFVCWNIELRAALYQRAWMNMGIVCGPLTLSALMDNVLTVMIDRTLDYPEEFRNNILSNGVIPGEAPHFYSKTCRFYLGLDNEETIRKVFNNYVN